LAPLLASSPVVRGLLLAHHPISLRPSAHLPLGHEERVALRLVRPEQPKLRAIQTLVRHVVLQ
jgi:hypothetical protein